MINALLLLSVELVLEAYNILPLTTYVLLESESSKAPATLVIFPNY